MSSAKLYGVYTAQFPFLEATDGKVRPVIVASAPQGRHKVIAIIPVSSKTNREIVDAVLNDWHDEGLIKPSVARVHRLTTTLQSDLLSELGSLTANDIERVQKSMRALLSL